MNVATSPITGARVPYYTLPASLPSGTTIPIVNNKIVIENLNLKAMEGIGFTFAGKAKAGNYSPYTKYPLVAILTGDYKCITVEKQWEPNPAGYPEILMQLYANGLPYGTPITAQGKLINNNDYFQWADLPFTDENNKPIDYTVKEVGDSSKFVQIGDQEKIEIADNQVQIKITNRSLIEPTQELTNVTITTQWSGPKEEVKYQLFDSNNNPVGFPINPTGRDENGNDIFQWTNLPKGDYTAKLITSSENIIDSQTSKTIDNNIIINATIKNTTPVETNKVRIITVWDVNEKGYPAIRAGLVDGSGILVGTTVSSIERKIIDKKMYFYYEIDNPAAYNDVKLFGDESLYNVDSGPIKSEEGNITTYTFNLSPNEAFDTSPKKQITVYKTWDGGNLANNNATIQVVNNTGDVVQTLGVPTFRDLENRDVYEFENLPNGDYTIQENVNAEKFSLISGPTKNNELSTELHDYYNLTNENKIIIDKNNVDISVELTWSNQPPFESGVLVQLYQNGLPYKDPIAAERLRPNANEQFRWNGLPKCDDNGKLYDYIIAQIIPNKDFEQLGEIIKINVDDHHIHFIISNLNKNVNVENPLPIDWTFIFGPEEVNNEVRDHYKFMFGYPEGDFIPNGNMTRAEATAMFNRILFDGQDENHTYNNTFSDVKVSDWYAKVVGYMSKYKMITGYPDGTFKPQEPITRAEFATIAAKVARLEKARVNSFSDVGEDHWAYESINKVLGEGWIEGYEDKTFKPENKITRAEAATIAIRILNRVADKEFIDTSSSIERFTDLDNSHWAYYNIMEAANGHQCYRIKDGEDWIRIINKGDTLNN